jgi:hypothetical protein
MEPTVVSNPRNNPGEATSSQSAFLTSLVTVHNAINPSQCFSLPKRWDHLLCCSSILRCNECSNNNNFRSKSFSLDSAFLISMHSFVCFDMTSTGTTDSHMRHKMYPFGLDVPRRSRLAPTISCSSNREAWDRVLLGRVALKVLLLVSVELILPVANGGGALIRLRCLVFVEEETEEEAEEEKETLEALEAGEAVDKVVPCNGEELMGNRERGLLLLLLKLLSIGVSGADTERREDNFFSCLVLDLDLDLDSILLLFLLRLDPRSVEVGGALWFFVVRVAWLGRFRLSPVILLIVDLIFRHLVFGARRLGLDNASSISQASSSFIVRGGHLARRTEGRNVARLKMTDPQIPNFPRDLWERCPRNIINNTVLLKYGFSPNEIIGDFSILANP